LFHLKESEGEKTYGSDDDDGEEGVDEERIGIITLYLLEVRECMISWSSFKEIFVIP
jgi:hypothetical protein